MACTVLGCHGVDGVMGETKSLFGVKGGPVPIGTAIAQL
jgi:hypothetical protein